MVGEYKTKQLHCCTINLSSARGDVLSVNINAIYMLLFEPEVMTRLTSS